MSPRLARSFALVVFGGALLVPAQARSGSMDPALERLVLNPECRTELGAIRPEAAPCQPDQGAFTRLVNQFGFAIAPTGLHPADTTGLWGFQISFEASLSTLDSSASYMKDGTRGTPDSEGTTRNRRPAPLLQLYSVRLRKGLGAGFEVAAQFGFMPQTSFQSGGADLRWAPLEGFRRGLLGRLPDVSLGGGVRTTTGSAQMHLTALAVDARISKPFTIRDEAILTPWFAFQQVWISGSSGMVDLTPATDAVAYCNPQGSQEPGGPAASGIPTPGGVPACAGSARDFENNVHFDDVRLLRPRLLWGVNYRYELLSLSAQVIMDATGPARAQSDASHREALRGVPRQWGLVLDAGVRF